MTDEQRAEAEKALKNHLGKCPNCGGASWAIAEIVHLIPYAEGTLVIGGASIPVLLVACTRCNALVQFSAVGLGIIRPAQKGR